MIYKMIKMKKVENKILGIFDFVKIMIDDVLFCVFFFLEWIMEKIIIIL